jgi:hypothetical protein
MSTEKACHGIGCTQHALCARYQAVEIEPERERMASCDGGAKFVPLSLAPHQITDDAERQVQWGQG